MLLQSHSYDPSRFLHCPRSHEALPFRNVPLPAHSSISVSHKSPSQPEFKTCKCKEKAKIWNLFYCLDLTFKTKGQEVPIPQQNASSTLTASWHPPRNTNHFKCIVIKQAFWQLDTIIITSFGICACSHATKIDWWSCWSSTFKRK